MKLQQVLARSMPAALSGDGKLLFDSFHESAKMYLGDNLKTLYIEDFNGPIICLSQKKREILMAVALALVDYKDA